jgi:hypothetical protein
MTSPNALAVATMIGTALSSPSPHYTERHDGWKAMRQPLHHTKPFEATAEARKRKKAERQRKKNGRKGR